MNSAEIEQGILSVKNVIDVAFPVKKLDTLTIEKFRSSSYGENIEPYARENPYKVDLKQEPGDLEARIAQLKISSALEVKFLDPNYSVHLDESFQNHLKSVSHSGDGVNTITLLRAYRQFLESPDYQEFMHLYNYFIKWEVLQEYLLSLGVELIDADGSKISPREIKISLPEPQANLTQDTSFKNQSLLSRIRGFITRTPKKN